MRDTNGNDALDVMAAAAEAAASAAANKRRRKQTQVPDQNKDQRYKQNTVLLTEKKNIGSSGS